MATDTRRPSPAGAPDATVETGARKPERSKRNHHLDAIRVSAILLLIPYHGARFLQKGGGESRLVDAGVWFVHTWHMPLFFAISGCLAAATIGRAGPLQQVRGRLRRLGVPLAIGMVTVVPLGKLAVILLAQLYRPESEIPERRELALENIFTWSPNHLWFIDYLLVISVIAVGVWVLAGRRPELGRAFGSAFTSLVRSPYLIPAMVLLSAAILMTKPGWLTGGQMSASLVPKPTHLAYFSLFFLFGWMLGNRQDLIELFKRPAWLRLGLALAIAMPGFVLFYDHHLFTGQNGFAGYLIDQPDLRPLGLLVFCTVGWLTLLGVWGVMARYVRSESRAMRYVSDASFWIYLIHIPILIVWQTSLAQTEYPIPFRYAVTVIGTTAVALGVYALSRKVRRRVLGIE